MLDRGRADANGRPPGVRAYGATAVAVKVTGGAPVPGT